MKVFGIHVGRFLTVVAGHYALTLTASVLLAAAFGITSFWGQFTLAAVIGFAASAVVWPLLRPWYMPDTPTPPRQEQWTEDRL